MKVYRIKQILSIFLCLSIAVSALTGCSKTSAGSESSSIPVIESTNNDSIIEEASSLPVVNPWRETTEEEISEIFGETFIVPEEAKDPLFRLLESEQLAELTFVKDGFVWTIRMKPADKIEDISGLNYIWDYESDIRKLSVMIDYIEPGSGPTSMSVEYQEKVYAHNGVYIGTALWYSKVKGFQYSTSYMGGDYTSFNTGIEVIKDLWPWNHDHSMIKDWMSEKYYYDEKGIDWPFGDAPEEIVLPDTDFSRQYNEMEAVLSLDQEGNTAYCPLQFESLIAALAEGANKNVQDNLYDLMGRSLEEERLWLRSLLYSAPTSLLLNSFLRFPGTNSDLYIDEVDLFSPVSYNVFYSPEITGAPPLEETLSSNLSLSTNNAITHVDLEAIPDEKTLIGGGITYYHPAWEVPYTLPQVGQIEFTNASGETNEVLGMKSTEHWYMENDMASGFMKFFDDGKTAFVGILPKEEGSFSIADLHVEELMASKHEKDVCAVIPEIIISETLDVVPSLEKIGFEELLKEGMFDQIIEEKAFTLSSINLTTNLRIDPSWQEPVSPDKIAGEMLNTDTEEDASIILDRPFVFLILDTQTDQVMFCGVIRSLE